MSDLEDDDAGMFDDAEDDATQPLALERVPPPSTQPLSKSSQMPLDAASAPRSVAFAPAEEKNVEAQAAAALGNIFEWPALGETVKPGVHMTVVPPPARIHRHWRPASERAAMLGQTSGESAGAEEPAGEEDGEDSDEGDGGNDEQAGKAQVVVVDTAGFIFGCPLETMGATIVTLPEVIAEIRDKATRHRMAGPLPYTLTFREPALEALSAGLKPCLATLCVT